MTNHTKSIVYALTAVLLWSTVAVSFKISLKYLTFVQLLFFSSWTSTLSILIYTIFKVKKSNLHIKEIFIKPKFFYKSAFMGFLNPFIYYIVLFKAYDLLPASLAQPLNYTWVIVISILSIIFLKQRISFMQFVALFISFLGVVMIALKGNFTNFKIDNPFGVILAVGSSLIWGTYWIMNLRNKQNKEIALLYNFLFGSVYITILLIVENNFNFNLKGILASVYVGLFEMGVTFIFWLKALQLAKNTAIVGNIVYLSPLISLLFISIILGEDIQLPTIFGLLLILTGAILQDYLSKRTNN